jgi:signal transduction histidine kinase
VGRMAASVAHEINNPLSAVMNALYLARTVAHIPKAARQYLDTADDELQRVSHITRQSLGFYREASLPQRVSVNAIMDSVVALLRGKIKAKDARIEKQYNGDFEVTGVAGELRQVFSNLLANSLDAIPEAGTIRLRVSSSTCVNSGQRRIRITVADNGMGINAATLPCIFEPLFTTKGSTGSGLGLWVSKQIIEKHHGSMRVRSCTHGERRGTALSILLPAEVTP